MATSFLATQLGEDLPWQSIYERVNSELNGKPSSRLKRSKAAEIAEATDATSSDVFAVLNLLADPEVGAIRLESRKPSSADFNPVDQTEVTEILTGWWRDKSVSGTEWKEWSSGIEVSWVQDEREDALSKIFACSVNGTNALRVTREENSNGHVDLTFYAELCVPPRKALGEAKIYSGFERHKKA